MVGKMIKWLKTIKENVEWDGISVIAWLIVAIAAFGVNALNETPCIFNSESLCPHEGLTILVKGIKWIGGPVDAGFLIFMAMEGVKVIFASLQKKGKDQLRQEKDMAVLQANTAVLQANGVAIKNIELEKENTELSRRVEELSKQVAELSKQPEQGEAQCD